VTYIDHFVNAGRYSGYVMLPTVGAGQSPMARALSAARSKLTTLARDANWGAITEHVSALESANVVAIGFEHAGWTAREQGFHILALRSTRTVDIGVEEAFVGSFTMWLETLKGFLPSFSLSADAQSTLASLITTAGLQDPVLHSGLSAVLTFAQSTGAIKCLSVIPATAPSGEFVTRWKSADLVSEPIFRPWIIEWLWDLQSGGVYEPGHSAAERSDRTLFGGAQGLQKALAVTAG
jgi:hypothetical protein